MLLGLLKQSKIIYLKNCQILKAGVGAVNDSDVLLAQGSKAEISTFNVKLSGKVKKLAETEKVKITTYNVIYELLEDIEKKALKVIEPTIDEKILGRAEILERFEMKENVAGCKVIEGEIKRGDRIAQLVIQKIYFPNFNVVQSLNNTKRGEGGFGHSGIKTLK